VTEVLGAVGQVKPDEYSSPTAVRLAAVIAPGIIMTPLSSILEATNAVLALCRRPSIALL
jgi:hypothetical protein